MSRLPITIATWDYDRVRALTDGRVQVEGCDVNYITMPVEECFERAYLPRRVRGRRDRLQPVPDRAVARAHALRGGAGLPVADVPAFGGLHPDRPRHRRTCRSARQAHRRARISDVGGDVVSRVSAGRVRHRGEGHQLGAGRPGKSRAAATSFRSICRTDFPLSSRNDGRRCPQMLADGELDGVMSARRPSCFVDRHPKVRALVSRLSHRRARLLPARPASSRSCTRSASAATCYDKHRWLAASLYKAFAAGKAARRRRIRRDHRAEDRPAWVTAEYDETTRTLMGEDFWSYGVNEPTARRYRPWRAILTSRASPYDC